jgi:tyrosinase
MCCQNAHGTPYFLPWHRAYLYFFERALQDEVPDATLAWWDWATPAGQAGVIPSAYGDEKDPLGHVNPLYSAAVNPITLEHGKASGLDMALNTLREPGQAGSPPLPSQDEIQAALAQTDYDHFRGAVEQTAQQSPRLGRRPRWPHEPDSLCRLRPNLLVSPHHDRSALAALAAPTSGR